MSRFNLTQQRLTELLFVPSRESNTTTLAADPNIAARLADMMAVLDRAVILAGTDEDVINWYGNVPIHGFGNVTAARLVADGRSAAVLDYLDALADGVFA